MTVKTIEGLSDDQISLLQEETTTKQNKILKCYVDRNGVVKMHVWREVGILTAIE